jgi:mannan endo-1,4-beta-mannosidase
MKVFSYLTAVFCSLSTTAFAAKSFSASNLYYAAGLTDNQQTFLLDGLKSAGVKVLRVWLDGEPLLRPSNLLPVADLLSRRPVG